MTDKQVSKTTEALNLAEEALNAMLTHMGMDEDEWTKPTFNQAREALAAILEALADHSGDSNEMVMDWSKVKPEAINSDPMYQMGYAAAMSKFAAQFQAEPVKQEPVCECRRKTEAVIESERLL